MNVTIEIGSLPNPWVDPRLNVNMFVFGDHDSSNNRDTVGFIR